MHLLLEYADFLGQSFNLLIVGEGERDQVISRQFAIHFCKEKIAITNSTTTFPELKNFNVELLHAVFVKCH
jgi:hypothetical protein